MQYCSNLKSMMVEELCESFSNIFRGTEKEEIAKSNNNDKRSNDTIHTSSEVTSSCDTEDFHAAVLRDLNKFTESKTLITLLPCLNLCDTF